MVSQSINRIQHGLNTWPEHMACLSNACQRDWPVWSLHLMVWGKRPVEALLRVGMLGVAVQVQDNMVKRSLHFLIACLGYKLLYAYLQPILFCSHFYHILGWPNKGVRQFAITVQYGSYFIVTNICHMFILFHTH